MSLLFSNTLMIRIQRTKVHRPHLTTTELVCIFIPYANRVGNTVNLLSLCEDFTLLKLSGKFYLVNVKIVLM